MSDEKSPFELPEISQGYPLDDDERKALREGLERLKQERAESERERERAA
jgi:hypothetical protein